MLSCWPSIEWLVALEVAETKFDFCLSLVFLRLCDLILISTLLFLAVPAMSIGRPKACINSSSFKDWGSRANSTRSSPTSSSFSHSPTKQSRHKLCQANSNFLLIPHEKFVLGSMTFTWLVWVCSFTSLLTFRVAGPFVVAFMKMPWLWVVLLDPEWVGPGDQKHDSLLGPLQVTQVLPHQLDVVRIPALHHCMQRSKQFDSRGQTGGNKKSPIFHLPD